MSNSREDSRPNKQDVISNLVAPIRKVWREPQTQQIPLPPSTVVEDKGEAPPNYKFIFEQVKERYDLEHARGENLDSKAGSLVGWIGLIISILFASGGVLFARTGESINITLNEIYLLMFTLALLLVSLLFSLVAYRIVKYYVVPEPSTKFIENYQNSPHKETVIDVTNAMAEAIELSKKKNNLRENLITVSWSLFLAGLFSATIFIIIQTVSMVK
jgi:hypothetical protein